MRALPRNLHNMEHGQGKTPDPKSLWPAHMMMPFVRTPIGYELVRPFRMAGRALRVLIVTAILLGAFCYFTGWMPEPRYVARQYPAIGQFGLLSYDYAALVGFVLLHFLWTGLLFMKRMLGQRRGEDVHTHEAGYSWFARLLPLPIVFSEAVLVPVLLAVAGYEVMTTFSFTLGIWLFICALSLMMMSIWEYRRRWRLNRAMNDDTIRADTYSDRIMKRDDRAKASTKADAPAFADLTSRAKRRDKNAKREELATPPANDDTDYAELTPDKKKDKP